jgi:23S rRNA (cytosine1962-C5)-methyltransferase
VSAVPTIELLPGRDRPVRRRHPWVFSGGVARVTGGPGLGETVLVRSADGEPLGWAAYSPTSQLRARMWTFDPDETVDGAFVAGRIRASWARRASLLERTDGVRVVYAESDGLPGLIADRYADVVVCELTSAGADRWRPVIIEALAGLPGVRTVYERSDLAVRAKEGLEPRSGLAWGEEPPGLVEFREEPWRFAVDVRRGHKTGFYLDQRVARRTVADLARGRRVLNLFAYTGAFSVAAAWGGATEVVSVDSSAPSLALAAENLRRNGLSDGGLVEADAFGELRRLRSLGERFDMVVVDPPKLASSERQVDKASRAYKDLNLVATQILAPDGLMVTFSCSGAMSDDLFQKVVFGATLDAGREARIEARLHQASDHPVALTVPESAYLKGLVCRVA